MIVVDTNVLVHRLIQTDKTSLALHAYEIDPDWVAPDLWRHEFANCLATFCRNEALAVETALDLWARAENAMGQRGHRADIREAIRLAAALSLSAYDAQYIVLARAFGVSCVTEDRRILRAAPQTAVGLKEFCDRASTG